jgi:hypothetical protein
LNRFRFFHELNLVVSEYGEILDEQGLLDHLLRIYDHPDFRPGMDELISFLNTRESRVSADALREIARAFPRHSDHGATPNLVAVVTESKLGQGLSRLYGAYADRDGQVTMDVFSSVTEAADWLDESRGRPAGTSAAVADAVLTAVDCRGP